eukprot:gene11756-12975_t
MVIQRRTFQMPNYACECFKVMKQLQEEQKLCDVVLLVDGAEFHAHRIILAGVSPYLRAMFTNGMLESGQKKVEISGIDAKTMALLIEFAYTGFLEVNIENVQQLLAAASMLNINALRNSCSNFLRAQLDSGNCLGIRRFADMYSCSELESTAQGFVYQNFLEVMKGEEFLQMPYRELMSLLKSDKIQVRTEEDIYIAFETWLFHDYTKRVENVHEILDYIRFPQLSLEFLESKVFASPYIKNDTRCQLFLAKVMNERPENLPKHLIRRRALPQSVYAIGGRNSVECQLNTLERYDIYEDQWTIEPSMNSARTAVGAACLDGLLYTVGGECAVNSPHEDTLYLGAVECFDSVKRRWFRVADIGIQRSFVSVAVCNGFLYAVGGEDRACSYNIVERFNPARNEWVPVRGMKRKRSGAGLAVCEGLMYVAGGYDRGVHSDRASVECYDPDRDEWTFVAELEKSRSGLVLVSLNGFIYALGGRNRSTDHYFNLCERYNPLTDQWAPVAPMITPRSWPAAGVLNNKIVVLGGFDGANRLSSVEMYDPDEDRWHHVSHMNISRAGCGGAVM